MGISLDSRTVEDGNVVWEAPGLDCHLIQQRLGQDFKSTTSVLLAAVNIGEHKRGEALCYIIEDIHREIKIDGRTRVPACNARMTKVTKSGILNSMRVWFPEMKFIVGLQDIPNFRLVRVHTGNDEDDTEGCPCVANGAHASFKLSPDDGKIVDSRNCYKALHNEIFVPLFQEWPEPRWLIRDESFLI